MNVFLQVFWNSFGGLLSTFGYFLAKLFSRLPLLLAGVVVFMLLWNVFVTASHAVLNKIVLAIPSDVLLVWGWVMPSNITVLFLVLYSSKLLRFTFDMQFELLKLKRS